MPEAQPVTSTSLPVKSNAVPNVSAVKVAVLPCEDCVCKRVPAYVTICPRGVHGILGLPTGAASRSAAGRGRWDGYSWRHERARPGRQRRAASGKRYGGTHALRSVDLSLQPGSVIGLIGENGAGKSTLNSIIAGLIRPDDGEMTLDGAPYRPASPADALHQGVALIHQEMLPGSAEELSRHPGGGRADGEL